MIRPSLLSLTVILSTPAFATLNLPTPPINQHSALATEGKVKSSVNSEKIKTTPVESSINKRMSAAASSTHHTSKEQSLTKHINSTQHQNVQLTKPSITEKPVASKPQGIVRVNDCLLISTIYTGNWNIECMLTGSTDPGSWASSWRPTPLSKKVVPKDLWAVCTWLNGFGYDQLITTPSLDLDPRLGGISRSENVYLYRHGYEVSGGASIITRLGQYCPEYGKNVHPAKKKAVNWVDYIPL